MEEIIFDQMKNDIKSDTFVRVTETTIKKRNACRENISITPDHSKRIRPFFRQRFPRS
jgi:hypothetical protein